MRRRLLPDFASSTTGANITDLSRGRSRRPPTRFSIRALAASAPPPRLLSGAHDRAQTHSPLRHRASSPTSPIALPAMAPAAKISLPARLGLRQHGVRESQGARGRRGLAALGHHGRPLRAQPHLWRARGEVPVEEDGRFPRLPPHGDQPRGLRRAPSRRGRAHVHLPRRGHRRSRWSVRRARARG